MLQQKVAVLGGGSFGTAIANIVSTNGHHAHLWMRDEVRALRCQQQRENAEYLPGYDLHENLVVSSDLEACLLACDVVVIAIPSKSFREVARKVAPLIQPQTIVISTTKGIEEAGFTLMSQVLEQELTDVRIGVLSGPNFAKEIIQNQFTGSVVASEDDELCKNVQALFSSKTFRIYSNHDRYGVELGGALKNIYAIISGIAASMGTGSNAMAMILTRSLAEMGRLARELGADSMTFLGLAGVGDLILTCTSDLSRNYRVGYAIGQGRALDDILQELGQVAEGVSTLKSVKAKAEELDVYMPLVTGLHGILFEKKDILTVVQGLMTGEMASDVDLQGGVS